MSVEWGIVIGFVCLMLVIGIAYRNATLAKLPIEHGEETAVEEDGVRVRVANGRVTIFRGCIVRLTDRRLIIAQKGLFGRRENAVLRYVLRHRAERGEAEQAGFAATIGRGYVAGPVDANAIRFEAGQDGSALVVISGGPGTMGHELQFVTARPGVYQSVLAA